VNEKVLIELRNISKSYDDQLIVDNLNLKIYENEFLTLLGPSGCGKTTTLRMIGGFEKPDSGEIIVNNKIINDIPAYARPINTVFQKYALFPHLNVIDNIAFGLVNSSFDKICKLYGKENLEKEAIKNRKKPSNKKVSYFELRKVIKSKIYEDAYRALELVNLKGYEKRKVNQLSGGQQQRVGIARAIVNKPKILLLDEPLSALDLKLRQAMHYELKDMQKKLGITFIFVTHDQEEAMTMSDRIVVMKDGIIQQLGTPKDIYNEPTNVFVADFVGESNIFNGVMINKKVVKMLGKEFSCLDDFEINERVDVMVRPEDVRIHFKEEGDLVGTITSKIFKGVYYEYLIQIGKNEILVKTTKDINEKEVSIEIKPDGIHVMKKPELNNIFVGCEVQKDNTVELCGKNIEVDLTQLIKGSNIDEEGYLSSGTRKLNLVGAKVNLEIDKDKIEISRDIDSGNITGVIVSVIAKADHYVLIVRTDDNEEFVVDSVNVWHDNEQVSLILDKKNIKVSFKGDIFKYEI